MKTYLDCIPCFMSQALRTARLASEDEKVIKKVIDKTAHFIQEMPMEYTPPEIGEYIYSYISEITGNRDPYCTIKKRNIEKAFELYDSFKKRVSRENDSLKSAVMLSIAGNVIDLGFKGFIDIENEILRILDKFEEIADYNLFRKKTEEAETILYLGDNSGEAVFDRFLLEQLADKKIYYAVRDIPVINDITKNEAELIRLGDFAEIISSGVKAPGTIISKASDKFLEIYNNADMVISKGQGNYEALSNEDRDIFFLLIAKCAVIARDIGTDAGTPLLLYKKTNSV